MLPQKVRFASLLSVKLLDDVACYVAEKSLIIA